MRIIKFTINEDYYEAMKIMCSKDNLNVKKKLNVLLSQDNKEVSDIKEFYPEDANENPRKITLKVNEEFYKGVMKRADILGVKASKYIPYLIYKFLA